MTLRFTALLLVGGCGWRAATAAFDGTGRAPVRSQVWIVGTAGHADMTATVEAGGYRIYCHDRERWPAGMEGRPVAVVGVLAWTIRVSTPVGARSMRDAAREGNKYVVSSCALLPEETAGELVDAERAVLAAQARRDPDAVAALLAPDFVYRAPGKPDVDHERFLEGVRSLPEGILGIEPEGLAAYRAGDTGIVRGVQVERVRAGDRVVEDRQGFIDVFARRDGVWRMTFALRRPSQR